MGGKEGMETETMVVYIQYLKVVSECTADSPTSNF